MLLRCWPGCRLRPSRKLWLPRWSGRSMRFCASEDTRGVPSRLSDGASYDRATHGHLEHASRYTSNSSIRLDLEAFTDAASVLLDRTASSRSTMRCEVASEMPAVEQRSVRHCCTTHAFATIHAHESARIDSTASHRPRCDRPDHATERSQLAPARSTSTQFRLLNVGRS